MNCFIDSNVWLFAFKGQDEEKTETARTLIEESEPAVSTQVVNETFVNLLRQADFTEEEVRATVASFYLRYPVFQLTQAILIRASELRERYSLSFWDSIIVSTALEAGVPSLYSEDLQHGLVVGGWLEIANPFKEA